ncbi:MAG: NAD(P)/FAD-dependent oxidoreductase [Gemmatimonadaceae bacterium]
MNADVVVVGGGVVGSSVAYQLKRAEPGLRVVVVERDPSYAGASSNLAMGGVRQQFATATNIQLARWSAAFYARFDQLMSEGGHCSQAWFRRRGYLFLVDHASAATFDERLELQRALGAAVEKWSVDDLRARLPGLLVDDLAFGVFGPRDGYANPSQVLRSFRAGAEHRGAEYVHGEVVEIERHAGRVRAARVALVGGGDLRVEAGAVVNAAGAYAARVGGAAGLELPIRAQRQHLFRAALPGPFPYRFPMVIDPGGAHWRHDDAIRPGEADCIVVARTRFDEPFGENLECDVPRWESDFRPPLVRRMPALADARMVHGWAGLYEMTPDHNPLLGEHPELGGFYVAAGFSGHGLMLAPATGLAVAEMIRHGAARTFDVSAFAPDRFARGALVHDAATL